jgi:hypothetical protein
MKTLTSEIQIKAKPEVIWSVLTDFENYSEWNPFILSVTGEKDIGKKVTVSVKPVGKNPINFQTTILKFEKNKELRWRGKFFIKGLFDGEHYFILEENHDGYTLFTHGEQFSGLLVGIFKNVLKNTLKGFILMNDAIKKKCEA